MSSFSVGIYSSRLNVLSSNNLSLIICLCSLGVRKIKIGTHRLTSKFVLNNYRHEKPPTNQIASANSSSLIERYLQEQLNAFCLTIMWLQWLFGFQRSMSRNVDIRKRTTLLNPLPESFLYGWGIDTYAYSTCIGRVTHHASLHRTLSVTS